MELNCYWQQEAQQETKDNCSYNWCSHTSLYYMFNALEIGSLVDITANVRNRCNFIR